MTRLRLSRKEAEAEAIRLATSLVAESKYSESHRYYGARPEESSPKGESGKVSAIWSVIFAHQIPGGTVDGGELFVRVDLKSKSAKFYDPFVK